MQRLLVVDDELDILDTVKSLIGASMPDVEVEVANNGLDAIQKLEDHAYDLVLTDYRMPRMDGLALVQWIQEHRPGLKALMFTAFMDPDFMARAHAAVPDLKAIPKPLDIDFFLQRLREALGRGTNQG